MTKILIKFAVFIIASGLLTGGVGCVGKNDDVPVLWGDYDDIEQIGSVGSTGTDAGDVCSWQETVGDSAAAAAAKVVVNPDGRVLDVRYYWWEGTCCQYSRLVVPSADETARWAELTPPDDTVRMRVEYPRGISDFIVRADVWITASGRLIMRAEDASKRAVRVDLEYSQDKFTSLKENLEENLAPGGYFTSAMTNDSQVVLVYFRTTAGPRQLRIYYCWNDWISEIFRSLLDPEYGKALDEAGDRLLDMQ